MKTKGRWTASAALLTAVTVPAVHAAGSDMLRLAMVGCGGRGTGAMIDALSARRGLKIVAMADAFEGRLNSAWQNVNDMVSGTEDAADWFDVPPERRFVGLHAYEEAIACDCDIVALCGPPGFRPMQYEAAVAAGKHVFLEKPVATDAPGVRRVMATNRIAKDKGLSVAVGHHLRHEVKHKESIARIHDGSIGELKYMRIYFDDSGIWTRPRQANQTELEFQVQNWYHFVWLSGDHICEQHVHDIDVANWMAQGHPIRAIGMGGRLRRDPQTSEIFDYHAVEFVYPNDVRAFSFCRQIPNCWNSFSEHAHGTKGRVDIEGHGAATITIDGQSPQRVERGPDGHRLEWECFLDSLRSGQQQFDADWATESTMASILGRMATYSGAEVTWDDALQSETDYSPELLDATADWSTEPKSQPDANGDYATAVPGVTSAY